MNPPNAVISLPEEDHQAIHALNRQLFDCETKSEVRAFFQSALLPWLHCDTVVLGWLNIDFKTHTLEVHKLMDCVGMPENEFESVFLMAPYFKKLTELIATTARPVIATDVDIPRETIARELQTFLEDYPEYIESDFMVKNFRAGAAVLQRPETGFVIGFNRFAPNERKFTFREVRQMELLQPSIMHAIKMVSLNEELQTFKALVETLAETDAPLALIDKNFKLIFSNSAFKQIVPLEPENPLSGDLAEAVEREARNLNPDEPPHIPDPGMTFYKLPKGLTFRLGLTRLNRPQDEADQSFLIRLHPADDPVTRLILDLQSAGLTPREIETTLLIRDGFDDNEIAERLFISMNTVRNHLKSIHKKLNVQSRQKLMSYLHSLQ